MPHSIHFGSFISTLKICLRNILKFLPWLIEWILYSFRLFRKHSLLFSKIVIGQWHSIRIVCARYVRIINDCIYIRRWWIEGNFYIFSRFSLLSALLSSLCLIFLKAHLLHLHYIVVFLLVGITFSILRVSLCKCYCLLAFHCAFFTFW